MNNTVVFSTFVKKNNKNSCLYFCLKVPLCFKGFFFKPSLYSSIKSRFSKLSNNLGCCYNLSGTEARSQLGFSEH